MGKQQEQASSHIIVKITMHIFHEWNYSSQHTWENGAKYALSSLASGVP